MHYAIYNPDGSIYQANKVYVDETALKKYEGQMHELGHKFVATNSAGVLPPELHYVDVTAQEICERPTMPIEVSKLHVKAGNKDSTVLMGIPSGARFNIMTSNTSIHAGPLDGTELELFIPVPCVYAIEIDCWPYKKFTVKIEAVS